MANPTSREPGDAEKIRCLIVKLRGGEYVVSRSGDDTTWTLAIAEAFKAERRAGLLRAAEIADRYERADGIGTLIREEADAS